MCRTLVKCLAHSKPWRDGTVRLTVIMLLIVHFKESHLKAHSKTVTMAVFLPPRPFTEETEIVRICFICEDD